MVVGFFAYTDTIQIFINPHWGVVGNVTGTFFQILFTNVIVYYHRKVTQREISDGEEGIDIKDTLGYYYRYSLLIILLSFGGIIVGSILKSIEFAY